jgi:hypothetical protein
VTSPAKTSGKSRIAVWPGALLMAPAAVAIWAGWVGLGEMTGFGVVQLLPGIWDGLRVNTSITLPVGMEAYAAYAMRCWLATGIGQRLRDYARNTAIAAFILGLIGQVSFHLMSAAGWATAPWMVTMFVSAMPIGVGLMGAGLLHLVREENERPAEQPAPEPALASAPRVAAPRPSWVPPAVPIAPPVPLAQRVAEADRASASEPVVAPAPVVSRPTPAPAPKAEPAPAPKPAPKRPAPTTPVLNPVTASELAAIQPEALNALTISQLRELAKRANLTQRGKRVEVLARIQQHISGNGHASLKEAAE